MMLSVNFDLSIASKLTGYTPVFLKPDCMFPTIMAWAQAGSKTFQKEPLAKAWALVLLFHSLKYHCHSFLNCANRVESNAWTIWLV